MKVFTYLVFILTINFAFGNGRALQKNKNSKFMLSHPVVGNFFRAQQYCQMYRMNLVSIPNVSQYNEIQEFLNNLSDPIPGVLKIWTSAHDLGQSNQFVWLANGMPVKNFESMWSGGGEPASIENLIDDYRDCPLDNCAALTNIYNSSVFHLHRNNCLENNIFLCEY